MNHFITRLISIKRFPLRLLSSSATCRSSEMVTHHDSKENNPKTPFEFTDFNKVRLKALLKNYPRGSERCAIVAFLDLAQRQHRWIPISALHKIADMLNIPRIRVYEAVTFYSMFYRRPRGKYHVQVCTCTPCWLRGSELILQAAEQACGCAAGGNSCDGVFGLNAVECQGACVNAPVMVVNDDYYEDLTVTDVTKIIQAIRSGDVPPCGPQSSRTCAEPITGLTTLLSDPPPPNYKLHPNFTPVCP